MERKIESRRPRSRRAVLADVARGSGLAGRRRPAMRRSGRAASGRATKALPTPPSAAIVALNRLGFGPRPGDIAAFNALGGTDQARLQAYVDQQLAPMSIVDSECDQRLSNANLQTLDKTLNQLWTTYVDNSSSNDRYLPYREVEVATFIRAIYSKRQLLEVLADFWHNHFNVYGPDYWIAPVFSNYDTAVIRGHALGNFRQMLEAVAKHPAMLYFLDNYTSSNAGPNENWAREMFELHGLGDENYLGVMQQSSVPTQGGVPIGYVDNDVYEATRAFTGWTYSGRGGSDPAPRGEFWYRSEWHDRFQKNVLGVFLPADQPDLKDGRDVLDAIASHPGAGRHIARKLARRLISDDPPQDVVDAAAAVFTAQWQAPDQLKQVVRTILLHPSFLSTWGEKIKRPLEVTASALRAVSANVPFAVGNSPTDWLLSRFDDCGQDLFHWRSPDGFPDLRSDWQSATPRIATWRLCGSLIEWDDGGSVQYVDIVSQTPPSIRTATGMADFWIDRVFGRPIPAGERQEIIDFMAAGFNPDINLPVDTDTDTADRLRSMVGLILMSPTFLWR